MGTKNIALGADIGGGHILVAAVNISTGRLIKTSEIYQKVNSKGTADEILDCWAGAVQESLQHIDVSSLSGIGFAMPGPFNYSTGVALFEKTDKYESLNGLNITTALADRLSILPEARYINDASAFAIGEAWVGKSADSRRSMVVTLGTGMGSAYVEDGLPVTDHPHVAEHGCLWHIPYHDGIADDYFSTRWFIKVYEQQMGVKLNGVKEIADCADDVAQQLFEDFGRNLGAFLRPWIQKFRPEVLVFGGSISLSLDRFVHFLHKEIQIAGCPVTVVRSNLNEQGAVLGAARLFDGPFWEKVRNRLPAC